MTTFITGAAFFKEQVSTNIYLLDVFYGIASVTLFLLVVSVGLIDAGLVQRKNVLDMWIGKLMAAMIAGFGMAVIGYSIWQVQFNQAFGVPSPVSQAIKDWWIGGNLATSLPQVLDPKTTPEIDVFQIFLVFFVAYAMVGGALIHSAGLERTKASSLNIIALILGGVVMPIVLYYTWGSVSPLTKRGVHDYMGVYSLYIVVGVWSLILAWRVGPRLGVFPSRDKGAAELAHRPHDLGLTATGVGLALFCVPFLALGCGYMLPDVGYFGISMTTSGFGLVFTNIFMAFIGGAFAGAIISYATKNPIMVLLGPVAGYIGCAASFDVGKPLSIFVASMIAPVVVWGVYELLNRLRIDDKKIVPLTLGGGVYAAIVPGIIASGHKTGGYPGLSGSFAMQNATINLGHQLFGLLITLGIATVSGLVVILVLEKTIGLRVREAVERKGADHELWGSGPTDLVDLPESAGIAQAPAR